MSKREETYMCEIYSKGFLSIIFALLILSSCDRSNRDVVYRINFLPCEANAKKSCYVNAEGNISTSPFCHDDCTPIINYFCVKDGTLYKIGDNMNDTTPIMSDLEYYGIMNEGLIPVCKEDEHISVVDADGMVKFQLKEFDGNEVIGCYCYSDSKLRVKLEDGSFIYVDKKGQKLFDKYFSYATDFKKGHAVVQTINHNKHFYSLVDENATPIFTFESDNDTDIVISHNIKLLSARENNKTIIYDFKGRLVLECPAKVCRIYSFCHDGFIYYNNDDDLGLMSYKGENLIMAKYEKLVPNGRNFLALTDDNKVRLVDKDDKIIKEFEGEDIIDFQHEGYDFPNVIERDDDYILIDMDGKILVEQIDIDLDQEDIVEPVFVESDYFPSDKVLSQIMELCGNGKGVSDKYGAFFNRSGPHCLPQNISFLSTSTINDLEGSYRARQTIGTGINYVFNYDVVFDEPIVSRGNTSLNSYAWLVQVEMCIWRSDIISYIVFRNKCINKLLNIGCNMYYCKGGSCILQSTDKEQLFVIVNNQENRRNEFRIIMMPNTDLNKTTWKSYIDNLKN